MKCYYCHKFGHYMTECPKLKNKEESSTTSSSNIAGVMEKTSDGLELVLAVNVVDGCFNDRWILD